jgi:hypothetical protein
MRQSMALMPLPSLDLGVWEYGMRVRRIAEACRNRKKRCVFLTQPTLWRADLSPAESADVAKTGSMFYDCHFTAGGSRALAQTVAGYLRQGS